MTFNDTRVGYIYKLNVNHEEWNGVTFLVSAKEGTKTKIKVLDIYVKKDNYYSGLRKDERTVDEGSSIEKGTVKLLGTKNDFPEFFL